MFGRILHGIASVFAPMFVRPRMSPGLLWTLHFILLVGICVLLWFIQKHFELMKNIEGPVWLRPYWMVLLFLLVYFLTWQAWWLWKLLQPGEAVSVFPDIEEAWSGVLQALEKAGIGIGDTAVYVVIGAPQSGEAATFTALPRGLTVNGAPSSAAPIRVYASREAIYLTCPGASLLTIQEAGGGVAYSGAAMTESMAPQQSMAMDASIGMDKSVGMSSMGGGGGGAISQVQQIIRQARDMGRSLTEEEKNMIRDLSAGAGLGGGGGKAGGRSEGKSVMQDAREVERTSARMHYFCSLIAKSRFPICPINGAVVMVSIAAAEKDEVAQQTGLVAQKDLANMMDALKLRFPVYSLVADLETLPGGPEFIQRFAADRRQQRLGKSFPLNPDIKPVSAPDAIAHGVNWIFQSLLPYWVYKVFKLETPNVETVNESSESNGNLFQFLAAVKDRAEKVGKLVSRAVTPRADEVPSYGGCYLTGLDAAGTSEPLFLNEFFKKVESTQGFVSWTDEAFIMDAGYRAKAKTGYVVLGGIATGVAALAVYVFGFSK